MCVLRAAFLRTMLTNEIWQYVTLMATWNEIKIQTWLLYPSDFRLEGVQEEDDDKFGLR
jgi:hypothetical protein